MTGLKAQIEISADASGVETGVSKAKRSLGDLGVTGAKAGKEAAKGLDDIGKGGDRSAQKIDAVTRNMISSIQRTTAAIDAGSRSNSKYFETLASQRGADVSALKPYLAQLDQVTAKQKAAEHALHATKPAMEQVGMSAKQTAAALRGVPAQFTDIVVSLQGGQAPMTVLLQQGGQLKDMFGGIGPAARALGGYVAGLVNPFTLAAAAAVGLGIALAKLESSDRTFNDLATSLRATGRAALITKEQYKALEREIAALPGMSKSSAEEVLAEFAKARQIGDGLFERLALSVADFSAAVGKDAPEAAKQLATAFADPVAGAKALDGVLGTLSASTMLMIEDAMKHNDVLKAQELLLGAVQEATQGLADRGLTPLQNATRGFGRAWDEAKRSLDASDGLRTVNNGLVKLIDSFTWIMNNGATVTSVLEKALPPAARVSMFAWSKAANAGAPSPGQSASGKITGPDGNPVQYDTGTQRLEKEVKAALDLGSAYSTAQSKLKDMRTTADVLTGAMQKLSTAGRGGSIEYKKLADQLAGVNEAIAAAAQKAGKDQAGVQRAKLDSDISSIRGALDSLTSNYDNAEKILEARRAAGLVNESEYWEAKRSFIRLNEQAQSSALQAEIDRLETEKAVGEKKIENDRKTAELMAKIGILRAKASADVQVLSMQETSANKSVERSYREAQQAAEAYLRTLGQRYERELAGVGRGAKFREREAGVTQIEDRYQQQRDELDNNRTLLQFDKKWTDEMQAQYDRRMQLIDEYQAKAIQSYEGYYSRLEEAQTNWTNGASEAVRNYMDQAGNVAKQSEELFTKAFRGMEDGLVDFVMTGKASFGDLARSIIADLIRIQVRQAMSGLFGGGGGSSGLGLIGGLIGLFGGMGGATSSAASAASTVSAWSSTVGGGLGLKIPSFDGGGHTGHKSRSGGLDGKGGFLALMHPRESVIDHAKGGSQSAGGPSVSISYAPTITIDSRTDRAEVYSNVQKALAQNRAQIVDDLQRARVIG